MQIVQLSHSLLHPSAYLFLVAYIANIMDQDQYNTNLLALQQKTMPLAIYNTKQYDISS